MKKASAGARIKAEGKSLIWVAPTAEQKDKIRVAAAVAGMPMSQFLLQHGLAAAESILKKM
jgi:uncharacterized protein (DUF1778 family)